jgi:hypothetical protein
LSDALFCGFGPQIHGTGDASRSITKALERVQVEDLAKREFEPHEFICSTAGRLIPGAARARTLLWLQYPASSLPTELFQFPPCSATVQMLHAAVSAAKRIRDKASQGISLPREYFRFSPNFATVLRALRMSLLLDCMDSTPRLLSALSLCTFPCAYSSCPTAHCQCRRASSTPLVVKQERTRVNLLTCVYTPAFAPLASTYVP